MPYDFIVNSWNWQMISYGGKSWLPTAAKAPQTCAYTYQHIHKKESEQNAGATLASRKRPRRAHRSAEPNPEPTQAAIAYVLSREPKGSTEQLLRRWAPAGILFSARSSLPSSLRLSQPSHGRPLSFLSSSIVTSVISVHTLNGLFNAYRKCCAAGNICARCQTLHQTLHVERVPPSVLMHYRLLMPLICRSAMELSKAPETRGSFDLLLPSCLVVSWRVLIRRRCEQMFSALSNESQKLRWLDERGCQCTTASLAHVS